MTEELKTDILIVDMQPIGLRAEVKRGMNLLEAAQEAGIGLVSLCGGEGWCYSCLIKIIRGEVSELSGSELSYLTDAEIAEGYRLACQVSPLSDLVINIPPDSLSTPQRLQVEGLNLDVPLAPSVKAVDVSIPKPGLDDLRSDAGRIVETLAEMGYPGCTMRLPVLADLSERLRRFDWQVRAVLRGSEVVAVLASGTPLFGVAVDIGTTKMALYLLSLESGEIVDKVGEMNPQIAYGEDVISRISFANQNAAGREILQQAVVDTLNAKIVEMCSRANIQPEQVVDMVVVGNTAIHHLFAGLPVSQLVYAPYVPAVSEAIDVPAGELGLRIASGAYVHLLPNIAGYVGADHAAVILATELWKTEKTVIAIDIGTNTEISLASGGKLLSCSCASGPAFEGAHIRNGMRAAPGAIERVQFDAEGNVVLFTIENVPPVGICGSGILDAVAEFRSTGVIDDRGAFVSGHPGVRGEQKSKQEYVLVGADHSGHGREITVTRGDITEIQLAKGAIRAGLEILLSEADIDAADVDEIIVAGAFGTYIDIGNAIRIGMFPNIPLDRYRQVGNAAGLGARLALLSQEQRSRIQHAVREVRYVELTTSAAFQDEFMKAMFLR